MLRPHLRPELPVLAGTLLLGLLVAALSAAQPLLTRMLIDDGLLGRHYERIVYACVGMLALAFAGTLLGGWHRAIYVRASGRVLFSLRVGDLGLDKRPWAIFGVLKVVHDIFFAAAP